MEIRFICPYWGQEGSTASQFIGRVLEHGYDGVEINIPGSEAFCKDFPEALNAARLHRRPFGFIAQQVLPDMRESVNGYIKRVKDRMMTLTEYRPDFINSHTGKDYFTFDDNCRVIEVIEDIAHRTGIPVLHETHRGRFAYHLTTTLAYLDKFPQLKLTGDFSHWCTVSESMLENQASEIEKIMAHVHHIHARIGHEHAPQVSDPFAPEWENHFNIFMGWWQQVINSGKEQGRALMTITPEFGPVPYMPVLPYSQKPLVDQWQVNLQMMKRLAKYFISKKKMV